MKIIHIVSLAAPGFSVCGKAINEDKYAKQILLILWFWVRYGIL